MKTAIKNKGYTLIELLVVITIGIIVFSAGFAGYREFSRRQLLSGITKQIKTDLRTAQQLALTGQKPQGATCTRLVSYDFDRINSTTYQIIAVCTNGPTTTKSVSLPTGITFTSAAAVGTDISDPISFKVLGLGTNLESNVTLTVSFNSATNPETIVIGKGGDIK